MNIPIENCISARPYRAAPERKLIITSILFALYAISIPYCYFTSGEPRRAAMIATQKLADEKWERESLMGLYQDSNQTEIETNSIVLPFSNSTDSFLNTSISMEPIIDSNNEFVTTEESQYDDPTMKKSSGSNSIFAGWFGPTREQKRAQQEFEKWQKSFREKLPEEGISLPSTYLPSALACVMLLGTLMLHALFHLLCHWIVQFRAFTLFRPATKVDEYCHILIVPPPNRGKSDMVPMKKSSLSTVLQVEFQRQVYLFTPAARLGASASKYPNGVFTLYQAPINLPLRSYLVARGLQNESEVEKTLEKWGKNHLAIHIPSFLELLQRQLLAPLAIFQVFCALLWLLDEYWSYTLWSLVSVVMFESTSVFQRTRTQNMLGGMSPKPTPVFVFRCGRWISMSTSDLLPGDLISLAYQKFTPIMAPLTGEVDPAAIEAANEERMAKIPITARSDIVPCDCLLVTGSAIVNEASLTGESVPQMKDAVTDEFTKDRDESRGDKETTLDMNGAHRVHTLFSGTSIITIDDKSSADDASDDHAVAKTDIPRPPDGGALAFVLKTGFHSSQGALLQMIEFSQQSVSGDSREIGYALLLLFCFALVASAYVLREGIRKKEKTLHEILLKCVIIITSVVPKELPMQIAMVSNYSELNF